MTPRFLRRAHRRPPPEGGERASDGGQPGAVRVEFQRVEYNLEATAEKIYATPDLDNFLGDRLRDGR
ncbi:MAG: hypothetical protein Ct9H300mP1_38870 [Planctomycetaceae bacterium]|nr:MAG: hypothetical protein Ct9H300mP1_38870 [Planctomycetaceae bacterium]